MNALDKRLRNIWTAVKAELHCKEFSSWPLFRAWSYANGYNELTLLRKNEEEDIWSKENCAWVVPNKSMTDDLVYLMAGWDRFADGIRQKCGMPPILTTDPCCGCPRRKRCDLEDTVCKTRERYWDVKMAQIRAKCKEGL